MAAHVEIGCNEGGGGGLERVEMSRLTNQIQVRSDPQTRDRQLKPKRASPGSLNSRSMVMAMLHGMSVRNGSGERVRV